MLVFFVGSMAFLAAEPEVSFIDLSKEEERQVTVDREKGQYLGHVSTCLLDDGKTILATYPKGHGRGPIVYKRSLDGGKTWSERLPTPSSWTTSKEVPTLHRMTGPDGKKRIIMWSGLYPARFAVSEDEGKTWSELKKAGDWGGIVVMGCHASLRTGPGHYLCLFHDDGRFFESPAKLRKPRTFRLYQTNTTDGGLTWSHPRVLQEDGALHLCEPGIIRSPDGSQLAMPLRENKRVKNSHLMLSQDEGKTWGKPRELPLALTGDRHTCRYGPDGRLLIVFRGRYAKGRVIPETDGDCVAWVGTYDDLVNGKPGQYLIKLLDNLKGHDTTYPGVEILPDGTFMVTTYGHWVKGEAPFIKSTRFTLKELDERAAKAKMIRFSDDGMTLAR